MSGGEIGVVDDWGNDRICVEQRVQEWQGYWVAVLGGGSG